MIDVDGAEHQDPTGACGREWLAALLACPGCHGPVRQSGPCWTCEQCGTVGRQVLGFPDFVGHRRSLAMAGDATMDLAADEQLASELQEACRTMRSSEVAALAGARRAAAQDNRNASPLRRRARARFNRNLVRVNAEAGGAGGEAILAKVDSKLSELGWPPMGDRVVLEAGGGEGLYIPAFSSRFARVVFVDASLANIVLAAAAAAEQGLDNVAFVRADVMALPFGTGLFDVVHQNGVVEHVEDPARMAREGARVRAAGGYYVCVSPNRMAVTPEPHFGLPAFGFIPSPLRAALIPLIRGVPFEEGGTDPRTLRQLRRYLNEAGFQDVVIFFLPRHLPFTARRTPIRRLVQATLSRPHLGDAVDCVLNRVLLPVVPHHVAIGRAVPETMAAG